MLAREHRLTSGRDFLHTLRKGRRAGTTTVVMHLALHADEVPPRVGLVVGKSVGPAVVRNRVKRRLRHVVRKRLDALPPGSALVIRAMPPAGHATSAEIERDMARALDRLQARVEA